MCANVYADLKMLQIDFLETLDFFVDRKLYEILTSASSFRKDFENVASF